MGQDVGQSGREFLAVGGLNCFLFVTVTISPKRAFSAARCASEAIGRQTEKSKDLTTPSHVRPLVFGVNECNR